MKKLEIIRLIIKEKHDESIIELIKDNEINLLSKLLCIDKKYLNTSNFNYIINNTMEKINKINTIYNYEYIVNLILKYPNLIDKIPNKIINKFETYYLVEIIQKHPNLINKYNIINKLKLSNWIDILKIQPKLFKYCNIFNEFTEYDWYKLLKNNPELIDKLNININSELKVNLLESQPSLINRLNLNNINEENFKVILYSSKEYYIKAVEKYIERFKDREVLTNMVAIYPDLKKLYTKKDLWKYVNFNQLSNNLEYSILK